MKLGELPFVVAVGFVAAIALVGLVLVLELGDRELAPIPFVAAVLFAVVYLWASHEPAPLEPASTTEEPFDDPVEEADRIGSGEAAPEVAADAPAESGGETVPDPATAAPGAGAGSPPSASLAGDDR